MKRSARRGPAASPLHPADSAFAACLGGFCVVSDGEQALVPDRKHCPPAARVAVADETGRWGYTTGRGACFFPVQYERSLETLGEHAGVRASWRRLFLDAHGRTYPLLSTDDRRDDPGLYLTARRGAAGWSLRTNGGALVTQFHDVPAYFHEGRALLKTSRGWCYLDVSGRRVCSPPSGQAGPYRNGRARFLKGHKWGFLDLAGAVVVEPRFDSVWNFSEGLAAVEQGGRWGYINEVGKEVLDYRFSGARDFSCGLARASPDAAFAVRRRSTGRRLELRGAYGFIDRSGAFAVPPIYAAAQDFSEDLAAVRVGAKWCYVDAFGRRAIPPTYSWASSFHYGRARVSRNRLYGYINRDGEIAVPFRYSKAFDYSEGLAAVWWDDAWGFIDIDGGRAIPPTLEDASPFRGGLARAAEAGRFGYIDRSGKWVIPPRYNEAASFSEGLALVARGKVRSYIDPHGDVAFVVP